MLLFKVIKAQTVNWGNILIRTSFQDTKTCKAPTVSLIVFITGNWSHSIIDLIKNFISLGHASTRPNRTFSTNFLAIISRNVCSLRTHKLFLTTQISDLRKRCIKKSPSDTRRLHRLHKRGRKHIENNKEESRNRRITPEYPGGRGWVTGSRGRVGLS